MRVRNFDMVESGHTQQNLMLPRFCIKWQAESTQKAEARRKKDAGAHAAKRQAESTQEADARRKKEAEAHAAKRQTEST